MRRSRAVDALRGVAVLLVLLHHLDLANLLDKSPWLAPLRAGHQAGFLGVSLFLVLSGFSIHLRMATGAPFRARQFLIRRLVRLHPTYLVGLAFALVTYAVDVAAGGAWITPRWGFSGANLPIAVLVVVHLTVVAGTIVPPGWLAVAWSLALEEHLYLLYAASARWLRRHQPLTWLAAGLAVCLAWRFGSMLIMPSAPKSLPPLTPELTWTASVLFQQAPARMFEWLLGALAAEWYVGNQRLPRMLTWRPTAAAALYGLWWLFTHRTGYVELAGHPAALTDLIFDPAGGVAFFLLLCASLAVEQRRRSPHRFRLGLDWVGERSYSLYLVHLPIMIMVYRLLGDGMLPRSIGRPVEATVTVVTALACAALLYRTVEVPSTEWSRRVGRSRAAVPRQHRNAGTAPASAGSAPRDHATAMAPGSAG
ncbi:MAG: acyltransferase [Actinobacteria bacterium]|nr:acyltransferase [Actinomycetota bacterium]